jgi:hypothetical protein
VNLILIGRCFVLAFLVAVLAAVFPIRFTEIAWQQQVLETFVNAGSVPITGRVFIVIALLFKGYDSAGIASEPRVDDLSFVPATGILAKRKIARLLRRVQGAFAKSFRLLFVFGPSLIFVLIAALQIHVSSQAFRALDDQVLNQVTALTQQASQSRAALSGASDSVDLDQAIRLLVPAPEQESVFLLSPQQRKSDLLKRVDERESSLKNQLDLQRTQRSTAIVWQTIKNVVVALLYGYCLFWLRPAAVKAFLQDNS